VKSKQNRFAVYIINSKYLNRLLPHKAKAALKSISSNGLASKLTRGAVGSLILKLFNAFILFLISIILARILGAEGYGIYSYALALITLLAVPTKLGLPLIVVRFTSSYLVQKKWSLLKGLLKRVNQTVLILSLLLVVISIFTLVFIQDNLRDDYILTFFWALALLPLLSLGAIRGAALRGLNRVILGQAPEYFIQPLLFFILIIGVWGIIPHQELTPALTMALQVFAALVAFIFGTFWLIKRIPESVKNVSSNFETKLWIKTALPLFLVGGAMIINKKTDILLLGVFLGAEDVGVYNVVVSGAALVVFSISAFDAALAPIFSKLYTLKDMVKLQKIVTYSAWGILLFSIPVALTLIIFSEEILVTLYGDEFSRGSIALIILCSGQLFNAARGPAGILLNMTGNERYTALSVAIAAILNIILNLIFIPVWGIEGAASATVISMLVWNMLLVYWTYKLLGIKSVITISKL